MSNLYIPAGIPGCGKTTWTQKLLPSAEWIASDAIRFEKFGPVYDHEKNEEVFDAFYDRVQLFLEFGNDTVADATNLQDFARFRLREIAEKTGANTHLLVFQNVSQAIVRNLGRNGNGFGPTGNEDEVPAQAMENMLERYEEALRDIPTERYTTVTYIGTFS